MCLVGGKAPYEGLSILYSCFFPTAYITSTFLQGYLPDISSAHCCFSMNSNHGPTACGSV